MFYKTSSCSISDIPGSPREYLNKFGVNTLVYLLPGPRPSKSPGMWGSPHVPGFTEWRVYAILRSRGVPALRAYRTVKRRGAIPTFLAVYLVEKYGRDGADIMLMGALSVPFGIQRVINALGVPEELFPKRNCGLGISAGASFRMIKQALKAIPYVG
jgi:hypothetical protein